MAPKKYVLTGGPSAGKSSILIGLEFSGESVVNEVATDYIRYMQAQFKPEPWTESNFQNMILKLQLLRECKISENLERIFLDRGIPDGLAYEKEGTENYQIILDIAKKTRYDQIFVVKPLEFTRTTQVRRENRGEALELCQKMDEVYKGLGYTPLKIEAGPLEERIKFIFEHLN